MTKPQLTAWRIQIVETLAGVYEFHVHRFTDHHFRITFPDRQMDYYPASGKAMYKNKMSSFIIPDIESFIDNKYKNK